MTHYSYFLFKFNALLIVHVHKKLKIKASTDSFLDFRILSSESFLGVFNIHTIFNTYETLKLFWGLSQWRRKRGFRRGRKPPFLELNSQFVGKYLILFEKQSKT